MKSASKNDPAQLTFAVFAPPVLIPQGDGSFIVRPGRPMIELSPREFGQQFDVDRDSIYRWIQEGLIPEAFVSFKGKRKLKIDAAAVPVVKEKLRILRST